LRQTLYHEEAGHEPLQPERKPQSLDGHVSDEAKKAFDTVSTVSVFPPGKDGKPVNPD